jgi:NADH-quinone oxidoreductase subunit I
MSHSEEKSPPKTPKSTYDFWERLYVPELVKGVAITTRHFLRNLWAERDDNPEVLDRKANNYMATVEYPEQCVPYPEGYRGLHRLIPREDGKPRCVACYMCATACPSQCIYIEAGEYPYDDENAASRVIEKYPSVFVVDVLRCVVCGLCVEACPKDALRMDRIDNTPKSYASPKEQKHASPELERKSFIYAKERLLAGESVQHPSDAWRHRRSSAEPLGVHKEAHTRIGESHE